MQLSWIHGDEIADLGGLQAGNRRDWPALRGPLYAFPSSSVSSTSSSSAGGKT